MKHLITLALLAVSPAYAVMFAAAPAYANMQDQRYCDQQHPDVDRKACMLERRNARAAMKAGDLETDPATLEKNRLARCEAFKSERDKKSCLDRLTKGKTAGDVSAGGTITEHREVIKK